MSCVSCPLCGHGFELEFEAEEIVGCTTDCPACLKTMLFDESGQAVDFESELRSRYDKYFKEQATRTECMNCYGDGWVDEGDGRDQCSHCDGSGFESVKE